MRRRLVLVALVLAAFSVQLSIHTSFAQAPGEQSAPPAVIESPPPLPSADEPVLSEFTGSEQEDAVFMLSELRARVRRSPNDADVRLKLAQGLYRVGDLDAAVVFTLRDDVDGVEAHLKLEEASIGSRQWL